MTAKDFYRDTWVEVDLNCIHENVVEMKRHVSDDVQIIAVVKANGYGHGDIQVAKTAIAAGATRLAVAILDEALKLRTEIPDVPILVLGAVRPEDIAIAAKHQITLTVFQSEWLKEAQKYDINHNTISFHIKLDTGMGRLGIREKEELAGIEKMIENDARYNIEGVFTHFATADEVDEHYFNLQYDRFLNMLTWFTKKPPMIHCANSATGLRFPTKVFNSVRFGISMYGLSPSKDIKPVLPFSLKEAFSFHSCLSHVKQVQQGEKISYGATYVAKGDEWIGTVPVGYADGWLRKLSDFHVLIDGEKAPIVGRICMDQFMVRLPSEKPCGTKVTLIGRQNNEQITIDDVAAHLQTINYEIPCTISARVPRVYINNA